MANILDAATIGMLWDALNRRPTKSQNAVPLLRRIASEGWASRADIEDIFYLCDGRLERLADIKALCSAFGLPWRTVFFAPKARSNAVSGSERLAAADVAELLIELERLGFLLDPAPLVEALLPAIKRLTRITDSEISVLWFTKCRHKMAPLVVQVDERAAGIQKSGRLKTPNGYKAEISWNADDQPVSLSVTAPKFRRRSSPQETICPDCGYTWYRGDPDSSANHRREHKTRMRVLDPKPLSLFASARLTETEPELVTSKSPAWKHKEVFVRALFFRREFQYDFVQWQSETGDDDPDVHGFLFADEADAIVGACAFRLRDRDSKKRWGLQWVWVCPKARRTAVLTKRWPAFRQRFGNFHVEARFLLPWKLLSSSREIPPFLGMIRGDYGLVAIHRDYRNMLFYKSNSRTMRRAWVHARGVANAVPYPYDRSARAGRCST